MVVFLYGYVYHRNLPVLTHAFPTRRSSDLPAIRARCAPPAPLAGPTTSRSSSPATAPSAPTAAWAATLTASPARSRPGSARGSNNGKARDRLAAGAGLPDQPSISSSPRPRVPFPKIGKAPGRRRVGQDV